MAHLPTVTDHADEGPALRFSAKGFTKLRQRLGLSAAAMGALIGVTAQSVYKWEDGKARPRSPQLQAIAAIRKLGKRAAAQRASRTEPEPNLPFARRILRGASLQSFEKSGLRLSMKAPKASFAAGSVSIRPNTVPSSFICANT